MDFTYLAYEEMLALLKNNRYEICNYETYRQHPRCVILRHDVDFSLEAALNFAKLEHKNAVRSSYFILLATSFYNIFHREACDIIKEIAAMGHDIGLHFDEANYSISNEEELSHYVQKEVLLMSQGLGMDVRSVSMHRPSKWLLEADLQFDKVINSYSKKFFNDFKYLSDSRMYWREDVYRIIESNAYEQLHILTHPIWYGSENGTMREKLEEFIRAQKYICYDAVRDNIRDFGEVLLKTDI